jgi:hypothetical protein
MFSIMQKLNAYKTDYIQLIIVIVGALVAAQVQYIQHGWINSDSILYLEAAKLFSLGHWESGFKIFPWPFYSLWIAATHKLTSLGVHHAAQLLNVFFFAVATYAFTAIIRLCGGKQIELVAGGLIFLSSQYMVGDVLEMLMRDEGFWAFFLTSLIFLIRYHQRHQLRDALLWQIFIIFAVLFRIEAITYLLLLPLALLSSSSRLSINIKTIVKTYSIHVLLAIAIILLAVAIPEFSIAMLGRLNEVFTLDVVNQFIAKFKDKSDVMSHLVLGNYLEEFAVPGLMLTFLYVIVLKAISTTGVVTFLLGMFSIKNHHTLVDKKSYQILIATMLIALLNMAFIITKVFVLSGRYVVALSLIMMVLASFYFAQLLKEAKNENNKIKHWFIAILLIIMVLGFVKNLIPKRDGYNYQQDAIKWLNKHNVSNLPVFYDDPRMRYYADYSFNGRWTDNWKYLNDAINNNSIQQYPFVVINHEADQPKTDVEALTLLPNYREIYRTGNIKNNKSVAIYKKIDTK